EAVAEHVIDSALAGCVGDVVQVAFGVGCFVVDGGRDHTLADRHHGDDQLSHTGCGDQVTHHTLVARYRDLVSAYAEYGLDRLGLRRIVHLRAGAVRVDVTDRVERQAAILERLSDAGNGAATVGVAVGRAEGVSGAAVAGQFGVDGRPA